MSIEITSWLRGLGLEQFVTAFLENDIDSEILPELTADDLIGLGVTSIGHRRKLLAAIGLLRASSPISGASIPSTERVRRTGDADIAASSAERRQLTVMFCDLVDSTPLASRLDPEDLREVLAAYHAVVAEVVVKFGGYIAKYMGDGVLAYFGYPQAHEHDAEQAVRAGLALIDRVSRLESGTTVLASRVGIATGLVVVGDLIGSGEAQERGVVGKTPNLAARLQQMAPANAVLVVESTRRLVGDLFDYRDLGAVALKGLAEPVLASQVLSESTVENRFEALRSMTLSPLVGRDEEVQLLLRRWSQAKEGEGQIVLISGEAGIGKSRIVAALQERLQPERPIRLRYFCSPHRGDSALFPIIAWLERTAGFTRDDAPAVKLDKLSALLCQSGDTDQETEAVFADLLSLPAGERYPPLPDDPRQKRERILVALVRHLESLAQRRPMLFLFEDAHWSDSTSLELLERLAERVRRLPVLVVVTFRPEFEPPWTGQAAVTSLTLSRLGQRATKALAGGVAGGKTLPAEILDRIIEHTDGIPLCIEELTKTLLEGTLLREADGQYVLSSPLPTLAIPSSLHDSLMARLDRLGTVKEVAQIGAAIGREFSYDTMKALAHRPDDRLRDELNQLVAAGLIFRRSGPSRTSFVFKHALVQDAAYGTLLRGRRQELHASIAKTLEEQIVRPPGEEAAVGESVAPLAYHWLRAEAWDKALDYTLQAAERAWRLLARPEAINHYWQALELIERLPHTPELDRVHCNVILSLIRLPGWVRDDQAETRLFRHVEEALKNATESGQIADVARLEALKGRHQDDEALLKSALVRAESSGDTSAEAFCANYYGLYLGQRGEFVASLGHIERAIEILGAEGNQLMQARTMVNGRCYSSRAGKLDRSLVLAGRVSDIADALDIAEVRAWRAWAAEPYFYKGLWDQAVLAAEEALPVAWEISEWSLVFFSSAWLALAYLKLGQPDKARRVLDRVFKEAPARLYKTAVYAIPYAQIARAEVHLITGNHIEALSTVRQALTTAERGAFRLEEVAAHRVLGQVHGAMGDRAEAEAAFRRSLEVCEKMQCPPELAQTLLAYGRFRRGDNTQEDEALIERALRLFEEMKATGWIEEARAALAAASPV
jgi:class 3 adenylate cyclase/tetratricopeptide (TPR) repeat protein